MHWFNLASHVMSKTAKVLMFLFLYLLFRYTQGASESAETRLIKTLMQGYSKYAKPTLNSSSPIQILFGVELVQIVSLQMMPSQVLRTKLWTRMKWKNELLTWDPSEFDGLNSLRLNAVDVWTPDIQLYEQYETSKSMAENVDGLLFKTQVIVQYDGTTSWNAPATFSTSCELDVTDFPYDTQLCTLKFGPWNSDISLLNMTADSLGLTTEKYIASSEWELLSITKKRNVNKYACCAHPFTDVTISLKIRRKPLFYWFNLVIPYALLLLCLWVGYFVPPHSGERISLSLVILLAFSIIVQATSAYLPRSNELPSLSILYFVVMIEVAVSALVTCMIIRVHFTSELGDKAPMPEWVRKYLLVNGENFLCKVGLLSKIMRQAEVKEASRKRTLTGVRDVDEGMDGTVNTRTSYNDENASTSSTIKTANEVRLSYKRRQRSIRRPSIDDDDDASSNSRERSESESRRFDNPCCFDESKLSTILLHIRTISKCFQGDVTGWEASHKWQRLAIVLDRFFFILLSIFTIVTFLSFTVIKPAFAYSNKH